jgi:xanthine dehydrogenase accessory factor
VVVSELQQPIVIRRAVAFASAVFEGSVKVEGVEARMAEDPSSCAALFARGIVPVLVDPEGTAAAALSPHVVVDARMAKRNLGTSLKDAPIVIGLGPGFFAGRDVHAVVETNRGHELGSVILSGEAEPDTHVPGPVQGFGRKRVLFAPTAGRFRGLIDIGEHVEAEQVVATVSGQPIAAGVSGVLRGILYDGLQVKQGQKVGDIDPRDIVEHCFTISDKANLGKGATINDL